MLRLPDIVESPAVVTPQRLPVVVARRGDRVHLKVGNADPVVMGYAEAMRTGQALLNEGWSAHKARQGVEIRLGRRRLVTDGRTAFRVGRWLLARGSEAKLLAGDHGRRVYV